MYTDLLANPYVDSKLLAWYDYWYELHNCGTYDWFDGLSQSLRTVSP